MLSFVGITRDHFEGKKVIRLEYEAYEAMALAQMRKIADIIQVRWPTARVAMIHRLGIVPVGEASVVISVSAPHRDEAYAASRFAIDSLKSEVPIWKKEIYEDGSEWKANERSV